VTDPWWRSAVIDQIDPRSFADADGYDVADHADVGSGSRRAAQSWPRSTLTFSNVVSTGSLKRQPLTSS
jgi:hypothetical protein